MIDKFNEWFTGVFENKDQAFGRPTFYKYVRIKHVKLDNGFFYGEQQDVWKEVPYRQFAIKPVVEGDKLIVKNYDVNKELHLGFNNLDQITEENLTYKSGCDNIINFDGDKFEGGIEGCDCYVIKDEKKTYVVNNMILGEDYYNVYDKGIDIETEKRVWGSAYGHYKFTKVTV